MAKDPDDARLTPEGTKNMSTTVKTRAGEGTTRIFIVDDHPMMLRGIRDTLSSEADLEVIGEARDAATAMRAFQEATPDLALIDLSLGRDSGLELIRNLKAEHPDLKVLVLSMHDDALYAERVLRAGALGYVNKAQASENLIQAIRRALSGEVVLSPQLTDQFVKRVVTHDGQTRAGIGNLSDRELQIFELVGRGLMVREIAEQLCISIKTVESHVEHIKTKLGIKSSRELVRRAALWLEGGNTTTA
jgi:DNA-binding NarL/FixJ family response regulator